MFLIGMLYTTSMVHQDRQVENSRPECTCSLGNFDQNKHPEESLNSHQIWYLLTSLFPKLSQKASDGVETRKPNAT
jgi:hypothetical protein